MNFVKALNEAARLANVDDPLKPLLSQHAIEVRLAIQSVFAEPTAERMKHLNGVWAAAERCYRQFKLPEGGGSQGGALREPAQLSQAA